MNSNRDQLCRNCFTPTETVSPNATDTASAVIFMPRQATTDRPNEHAAAASAPVSFMPRQATTDRPNEHVPAPVTPNDDDNAYFDYFNYNDYTQPMPATRLGPDDYEDCNDDEYDEDYANATDDEIQPPLFQKTTYTVSDLCATHHDFATPTAATVPVPITDTGCSESIFKIQPPQFYTPTDTVSDPRDDELKLTMQFEQLDVDDVNHGVSGARLACPAPVNTLSRKAAEGNILISSTSSSAGGVDTTQARDRDRNDNDDYFDRRDRDRTYIGLLLRQHPDFRAPVCDLLFFVCRYASRCGCQAHSTLQAALHTVCNLIFKTRITRKKCLRRLTCIMSCTDPAYALTLLTAVPQDLLVDSEELRVEAECDRLFGVHDELDPMLDHDCYCDDNDDDGFAYIGDLDDCDGFF